MTKTKTGATMKVRELVAKLSKVNQDLDVICYTEDEKLMGGTPGFLLLDVQGIDEMAGEYTRDENQKPGFKIAKGGPTTVVVIEVTPDF